MFAVDQSVNLLFQACLSIHFRLCNKLLILSAEKRWHINFSKTKQNKKKKQKNPTKNKTKQKNLGFSPGQHESYPYSDMHHL